MLEHEKELAFGYWCEIKGNPIPFNELSYPEKAKILAKARRRLWWSKIFPWLSWEK